MIYLNRASQKYEYDEDETLNCMGYSNIKGSEEFVIDNFYTSYPEQLDLPKDFNGLIVERTTYGDTEIFVQLEDNSIDVWISSESNQTLKREKNFKDFSTALEAVNEWC